MVLFMACISMTISTLPLALLNTQANTTDTATICTRSDQAACPTIISGRCQKAQRERQRSGWQRAPNDRIVGAAGRSPSNPPMLHRSREQREA